MKLWRWLTRKKKHAREKRPRRERFAELEARIRLIVERNPLAFPPPVAERLLRPPIRVQDSRLKELPDSEGGGTARQLLGWDPSAGEDGTGRLLLFLGSFTTPDGREDPSELDAPTILAWRLFEDLAVAAEQIENALLSDPSRDDERLWEALGDELQARRELAQWADDALADNPQFFPRWMLEELAQGAFVIERGPEWASDALGFFEDTVGGKRIVVVLGNLLALAEGQGRSWLVRELLLTLIHEFEHHYGDIRGYDPLAERESGFL